MTIEEISDLLDPATSEENADDGYDIFSGEAEFRISELQHCDSDFFRGLYILTLETGKREIECSILCDEYPKPQKQSIEVEID